MHTIVANALIVIKARQVQYLIMDFFKYCQPLLLLSGSFGKHNILIITSVLFVVMVSSALHNNVRLSTTIIASAAVITLLFLPLTVSTNNNALLQSQSVFAQVQEEGLGTTNTTTITNDTTTEQTDFLLYENPTHGIFIWYPAFWNLATSGLTDYTELIAFYSPLQNFSDIFPARLTIAVVNYVQNVSLPEYTNSVLTRLNQSEQIDVRNSSDVTIAGYPGHRVVLATQPFQNSTLIFHQMNTWTTIGNKVYLLTYEGEESTFNQHLPEVSQMLETLRIARNNNMTTTTGGGVN